MKRVAKFSTLLMMLILVLGLSITAHAAGSVTYDGDADKFIFAPGTEDTPTSLFENFRNVMPGDVLMEQIQVKNDTSNDVKIKVYMRSLGAQESTDEFLSQMKLTVQQQGSSILFAAPADETAQLTDWVCLGTVYSGGEITLDVALEVPITMGDDYQNEIGYIDWQFKIEELPVESSDPEPDDSQTILPGIHLPKTGDASNVFLYIVLVGAAGIVAAVLVLGKRKKKK